jgi:hypothetical protein
MFAALIASDQRTVWRRPPGDNYIMDVHPGVLRRCPRSPHMVSGWVLSVAEDYTHFNV